jgi:hypothetical protein
VTISDEQVCSPIPYGLGAACDNFLTSNPQTLTEEQWTALQDTWGVTECVSVKTLGDVKAELEDLCSKTACSWQTTQAISSLKKLMTLNRE